MLIPYCEHNGVSHNDINKICVLEIREYSGHSGRQLARGGVSKKCYFLTAVGLSRILDTFVGPLC